VLNRLGLKAPNESGALTPEQTKRQTAAVRAALNHARGEAHRLMHDYIGTEHILLGLTHLEESVAMEVLARGNISAAAVRTHAEATMRRGHAGAGVISPDAALPFTSRGKKVLEFARQMTDEFGALAVDTEHVLLGLLAEQKGLAAQTLEHLGLSLSKARSIVSELAQENILATRAKARFHIRVDDASDKSIYEQIITQIQEAIATGVLQPNDQLPTVRQLADELDIAPGTVARAYGELEGLGVVVTKGIRGTRIAEREPATARNPDQLETLSGLLRPVAVAAFHFGATSQDLRTALEQAMQGIFAD
ncbi:MAG: Clp protease N-terminal domain-containing protein, partial [Longimicrobiales bacterium]